MTDRSIEQRFEQLEEKLAYLEMNNVELNDEIFRQQKDIDALTKAHRSLLERLETLQDVAAEGEVQEDRPPHY
jgi:SlyX protein|tara:strand:+ start:79 stop:297 length:219 start_codon:yes stop_codon:yes gene_type:complete